MARLSIIVDRGRGVAGYQELVEGEEAVLSRARFGLCASQYVVGHCWVNVARVGGSNYCNVKSGQCVKGMEMRILENP